MDPKHLQELIDLEDGYWWHVAKRDLVKGLVAKHFPAPTTLVEGGIGACRNLLDFRSMGYEVVGYDISADAVAYGKQRGLENVAVHDLGIPWPLDDQSADVVVMLDVLEHLESPVDVLRHASRVLRPGGGVVFTVPAYPWLFGHWDRRLGHFRRYTVRMLRQQAAAAGLNVQWLNRWNSFTLPAAIVMRGWDRLFGREKTPEFPRVSPAANQTLLRCASMERSWLKRFALPLGLSLVGVLRK